MHDLLKPLVVGLLLATTATAHAQDPISGTFALAGAEASVTGQVLVTETAPSTAQLSITFADAATGTQITDFAEELTQELHVLAVDSSLSTLVHQHVKAANPDGVFTAQMQFPRPRTYHIYADAAPEGLGQQVLRFDVQIGGEEETDAPSAPQRFAADDEITLASGEYEIKLDASGLLANEESMLKITILKDDTPATDLHPYLGVPAHAVLVKAEDLSYVHAHPMEKGRAEEHGMHGAHADAAMEHDGHGAHAAATEPQSHGHAHADMTKTASPAMTLHMTPGGPGDYTLFLEFIGGDKVHTIAVPLELA